MAQRIRGDWKLSLVWGKVYVSRRHPHPALRATFPLKGGRLSGGPVCRPYDIGETFRSFRRGRSQTGPRATARVAPTAENGPGSLVRKT